VGVHFILLRLEYCPVMTAPILSPVGVGVFLSVTPAFFVGQHFVYTMLGNPLRPIPHVQKKLPLNLFSECDFPDPMHHPTICCPSLTSSRITLVLLEPIGDVPVVPPFVEPTLVGTSIPKKKSTEYVVCWVWTQVAIPHTLVPSFIPPQPIFLVSPPPRDLVPLFGDPPSLPPPIQIFYFFPNETLRPSSSLLSPCP